MRLAPVDAAPSGACARYLRGRADALFFQSTEYVDFLAELLGARNASVAVLRGDGSIGGVLPLLAAEGPWGSVLNSLPFYGSNGGVIADDDDARRLLLNHYNRVATGTGTAASTIVTSPLASQSTGAVHNLSDYRIGQMTPIAFQDAHAERLMDGYHQKTRNMVRKAERCGVTVDVENGCLDFLRATHEENLRALGGIPKPARFFELVPQRFRPGIDYRIYVARIGGAEVAAMLLFYFSGTVEYFMPAVKADHRGSQPLSLLIYQAMTEASREGYRWWNWGGTWPTQDGVHRFKKRWGTEDRRYEYYVQLNRPELKRRKPAELLAAYPNFYVLPFSALEA